MSGLVLKLDAGERFVVNGAVLENGDRPARIRIADGDARVLRCRDALKPDEVDTPLKQIYFAIQLLITGDIDADRAVPAIQQECARLADIFVCIDADFVPALGDMVDRGNYYSALCHLRQMMAIEARLLDRRKAPAQPLAEAV